MTIPEILSENTDITKSTKRKGVIMNEKQTVFIVHNYKKDEVDVYTTKQAAYQAVIDSGFTKATLAQLLESFKEYEEEFMDSIDVRQSHIVK